jgi:hypothetical protein
MQHRPRSVDGRRRHPGLARDVLLQACQLGPTEAEVERDLGYLCVLSDIAVRLVVLVAGVVLLAHLINSQSSAPMIEANPRRLVTRSFGHVQSGLDRSEHTLWGYTTAR